MYIKKAIVFLHISEVALYIGSCLLIQLSNVDPLRLRFYFFYISSCVNWVVVTWSRGQWNASGKYPAVKMLFPNTSLRQTKPMCQTDDICPHRSPNAPSCHVTCRCSQCLTFTQCTIVCYCILALRLLEKKLRHNWARNVMDTVMNEMALCVYS